MFSGGSDGVVGVARGPGLSTLSQRATTATSTEGMSDNKGQNFKKGILT